MPELQTVVQLKNDIVQNRMEKLLPMSTESWGNEEPCLARGEAEFEEQAVENKIGRLCSCKSKWSCRAAKEAGWCELCAKFSRECAPMSRVLLLLPPSCLQEVGMISE